VRHPGSTRIGRAGLALLTLSSLLVSCSRGASGSCPASLGLEPATTRPKGDAGPLPPVAEALWAADETGTLRAYDAQTGRISAQVDLGRPQERTPPPPLITGGGLIWAYRYDGVITMVDPVRARVTGTVAIPPARPLADLNLSYAHGALWVSQSGRMWRIRPSGAVTPVALPPDFQPTAWATTDHWLWLGGRDRRLIRVDPVTATATIGGQLPVDTGTSSLFAGREGLFASGPNSSDIWILDPETAARKSVVHIKGELVSSLVDGGQDVWAIGNCGTAMRLSGSAPTPVGRVRVSDVSQDFPATVALGSLWIGDEVYSELIRLDLATGKVTARLAVPAADPDEPAFGPVAGAKSLWLIDGNLANGVLRVDPATNRVVRLAGSTGVSLGQTAVVSSPPA
jgi:outer membrane protein assembly factor BamB